MCTDGNALLLVPILAIDAREQEAFATAVLLEVPEDEIWIRHGLESLHRRDLLPGWYDDWVIFERERLRQLRLHALEHTARLLLERRDLKTALQLALEAVRTEPLRETATALLMSVYLAEGNVVAMPSTSATCSPTTRWARAGTRAIAGLAWLVPSASPRRRA